MPTVKAIAKLRTDPDGKQVLYRDDTLRGFGVLVPVAGSTFEGDHRRHG